MKPKMPKPSSQLMFAAAASVLALSALAVSTPTLHERERGGAGLIRAQAGIELPHLPAFPSLLPR